MKASFVVSGSQDCTVKVWDLPADVTTTGPNVHQLTARTTEKAHEKVQTHNSTREAEKEKGLHLFASVACMRVTCGHVFCY